MPLPQANASATRRSISYVSGFLLAATVVIGASMVLITSSAAGPVPASDNVAKASEPILEERAKVEGAYGKLPLSFERNMGQLNDQVRFVARGVGYSLFLTSDEAVLSLRANSSDPAVKGGVSTIDGYKVVRMKLVGANSKAEITGLDQLPGKFNYFIGNDAGKWFSDVPLYSSVHYKDVYRGIDMLYYGNQRQLEYDFQVAPGHDPRAIKIEFEGADRIKVDKSDGSLVLAVDQSEVRFKQPVIYQVSEDGGRRPIEGGYSVRGKAVQFRVGNYDSRKPLVIDPILSYSTYLGSNFSETGWGIAVDASGSAYVTGQTGSFNFPTTGVNFIPVGSSSNAFVTKLDRSGSSLVYSTLIGGSTGTSALAIALDASGAAYITGRTSSSDFPTVNPIRSLTANLIKSPDSGSTWASSNVGLGTLRVNRLVVDPSVPSTVYALSRDLYKSIDSGGTWTRLNTGADAVAALAIDPQTPTTLYAGTTGAPAAGVIKSTDGGATWLPANSGLGNSFVSGLGIDPQNPATIYAGSSFEVFKSTNGGSSWTNASTGINFGNVHAFVFDPTNSSIVYAAAGGGGGIFKTVNGGANWVRSNTGMTTTVVTAVVMNPTTSTLYVGTAGGGVFKSTNGADGWSPVNLGLTRPNVNCLAIIPGASPILYAGTNFTSIFKSVNGGDTWSKVHGGLSSPQVTALAASPAAPTTIYAGVDNNTGGSNGDSEAFVTKLNPAGNALVFSTFLGGGGNDEGGGIAVDNLGNVIVTGQTASTDFPLANPRQANLQGTMDAFVTKFAPSGTSLVYSTYLGGTAGDAGRGIAVDSTGNAYVAGVTFSNDFPTTPGAFQTTFGNAQPFQSDAFITKINAAGSQYIYSTYLGGDGGDAAFGIAINAAGDAFVVGSSGSSNFPLLNPVQPGNSGGSFVTKLNATGSGLGYSSVLGSGSLDQARGIAVDAGGNAYVTGLTRSSNFPITPGALRSKSSFYQTSNGGALWTNDNSGLGGPIQDLALNPTSSVLYAATSAGVYRSVNLGRTWDAANTGLTNLNTTVLAIDSQVPTTIYVGEGNFGAGIFKSTNGGASWASANGNQNFTNIAAIAVDPVNHDTVYLSAVFSCFKSTNGGTTWNAIGGNLLSSISSFAINPQNPQIVYATSNSSGGGVLKSIDGGATWNAVNNGLNASGIRMVIDPVNTSTLYVATNFGVFKSIDAGGAWTNVLNTNFISNLAIDPASPATIYATTFNGTLAGAIFKTTNGGVNWTPLGTGVIQSAGRLLIDAQTPGSLYVVGNPGFFDQDAFVSKFSSTGNLTYSSYLGGQNNPGDSPDDQGLAIAVDPAGNAYVAGVARSKDFPVTANVFQPFNRGFDDAFITKLSPSFNISGVVTNGSAIPQSGVKVTLSGSSLSAQFTGADGTYLFTNLQPGGNYTVSATKTGFSFAPPSQSFSNLSADQTANFTSSPSATPFLTISGKTSEPDNTPIPGVTVSLTGSQIEFATTDNLGNYSFSVPQGGNYTVTAAKLGFLFSPANHTATNLSQNVLFNFEGTRQAFVVTNTNNNGAGSLRQAITDANVTLGADRIVFQIPGAGVQTIRPNGPLPEIKDAVTIDGTTQPGFSGSPLIELDGSSVGISSSGLTISGGNSTVRALVINRFPESGINLTSAGGNHIEGNIIGLDPTGSIKRPNLGNGISVSLSSGNFIGGVSPSQRNIISGNRANGISLVAAGNVIKGNYIGTNSTGTAALGNGLGNEFGITMVNFTGQASDGNQIGGTEPGAGNVISGNSNGIDASGSGTIIQGNLIGTNAAGTSKLGNETIGVRVNANAVVVGGTAPGARNIISGNGEGVAVNLFGTDPFVILKGNYIGTDISGTAKLGNAIGVFFTGRGTIGGTEPGAGNLISGNDGPGIQLNCCGPGSTTVLGNLIGTDATGLLPLGNGTGLSIQSSQNVIGGSQQGARNVISGNGIGLSIDNGAFANVVQGNNIGLDALANAPLGNTSRGVEISNSSNTILGGDQFGESNVIAFNGGGVVVSSSVLNTLIRGNIIFSNSGLGIDLDSDGVPSPNDPGDTDSGANRLQNFPVLSSITTSPAGTNVKGSLNSTASTPFRIDFYDNQACDVSGNGEGTFLFGSTTVTTDANGNAPIDVNLTGQMAANRTLTATATDPDGNTSEFSPCNASVTAGSLEFSAFDFNAREDVGSATIKVVRTGGGRGSLTVNYATGNGTATAGADYTATSGSFTFADGESEKTFNVPIANDGVAESEETVELSLSGNTELETLGARYRATLHIFDSNTPLTISGGDAQIVEGDVGQRNVVVPITLSAASGQTVSVNYATGTGGSSNPATSGKDFLPVSGRLVFNPGVETQNILIPILADTLDEFDETFIVTLSISVNATVVRTPIIKIFDDDPLPTLSVTDVSVVEAAGASAVFTVRLSAPSGRLVQLGYSTANDTATAGSDYTTASNFLNFSAGLTLAQVSVPILTDSTVEPNETFFLNLVNPTRATIADGQGVATIIDQSASSTLVQFSAVAYTVNEGDGQVQITVTRTGSTTSESSVSYKTVSKAASDRSDFTPSAGTLRFAPGETSKTFNVLVTDDAFLEPPEPLDLELSNPVGTVLGGPNVAGLTIISNDVTDGPSPVREQSFDTRFFVRQHYHDFLNREADTAGLDFWADQIDSCTTAECRELKKINVSAAFFLSIEFQETGYLAYRMYNAAYGETTSPNVSGTIPIIRLQDFIPDTQEIGQGVQVGIGNWQQQLEANKTAYAVGFVQRQRFITTFPLAMTSEEFVNKLDQNTNGVLSAAEKAQFVAMLGATPADPQLRGSVVRRVAEDSDLRQRELNRAFVLMQYYGYLRRNPDDPQDPDFRGWKFWLDKLNQFNGNFVDAEMVKAFLVSGEYRQRFGTP